MTRVGGFQPVTGEPKNTPPFTNPVKTVKPTPGKTPVPKRTVTPAPKTKPTTPALTPEQLAQQAVTQSLAPLYAQAQQREQIQQAAVAEFTKQLIAALGNIPGQTQADYSQAMAGQSQIAQAAGQALQQANPNAGLQQNLSVIGAPQSQQNQVAGALNNAFNGGAAVQMYTGGVLPVGTMAQDETAALTNERQLPAIEALRGQQALGQVLGNYQQTVSSLDAQQPDLVQKYVSSYTAAQQKAAEDAATNAYHTASLKLAGQKAQAANALSWAKLTQAAQNQKSLNAYRNNLLTLKQEGMITDAQYKQATLQLKRQSLAISAAKAAKGSSAHLQSKNVNGHTLTFDPSTGTYYIPGTTRAVNPNAPMFAKPPKPLSTSMQTKMTADIRASKNGVNAAGLTDVSKNDPNINTLYTHLLSYGANEQQTFKLLARFYPGWAARNQKSFTGTPWKTAPNTPNVGNTSATSLGLTGRTGVKVAPPTNITGMNGVTLARLASQKYVTLTPQQAKQAAAQIAQQLYGWGPSEFASLLTLWNGESNWDFTNANYNGGSSYQGEMTNATGIPQALGHQLPANFNTNAVTQILWGLNYIKNTYGAPSKALAYKYGAGGGKGY